MKPIALLLLGVAVLVGCGSSTPREDNDARSGNESAPLGHVESAAADATITFEINSWGKPITSWRIGPDGEGIHVTYPDSGNEVQRQEAVVKRFSAGTDGYRRIRELMRDAEGYRRQVTADTGPYEGGELPCLQQVTDHPYGKVEWSNGSGRSERVRIDEGCKSPQADAFHRNIRSADELIRGWSAGARAERVPAPAGHGATNDPMRPGA